MHVDSVAGVGDDDVFGRFIEAMRRAGAQDAACGMTGTGSLTATFQVDAMSPQQAGGLAAIVVMDAMRASGVDEPLIELDRLDAYRGGPR